MRKLLLVLLMLAVPTVSAAATTVSLSWDANTEADLAGYRLYQSQTTGGPYTLVQTLGKVTTASVAGLPDGRFYWVMTAFDAVGNESGYSNEATFSADSTPPMAPGSLRVTGAVVTK